MSLKSLCNALSRRPQSLDVFLEFTSPISILQPLCQLLDGWRYEDDQGMSITQSKKHLLTYTGEYQPVYDEFASIFLLVLAFVYRYSLSPTDMGIPRDSFVSQYMMHGHKRFSMEELSDEQSKHLESWAKGLFGPDGITEEVTGSCRPQQFYMLVPTLFSQTLLACSQGHLVMDTVKNNLECKPEPTYLTMLHCALTVGARFT
jgi:mediator of RNA polymerase II transcription subunit 5